MVPTYLALADLTPSDQWVTQWDSIRQYNPQAIDANSRITEIDGQVLTQFPQRSAPAQCGLSSPSILSTTANNFTVHSSSSPSSRLLVQSIPYEVHEQVISQLLTVVSFGFRGFVVPNLHCVDLRGFAISNSIV